MCWAFPIFLLLPSLCAVSETMTASDPRIKYLGRWLKKDDGTNLADWPRAILAAKFRGTIVSANLLGSAKSERFLVRIDSQDDHIFVFSSSKNMTYVLASKLTQGLHTLELIKLTESTSSKPLAYGVVAFSSLTTDGKFLDPPAKENRKLWFIGDSDTAGFCADGRWSWQDDMVTSENSWVTWASHIARTYDADAMVTAISGIGVLNWPIQRYLNNTLEWQGNFPFNQSTFVPDAVIALIGPNDFGKTQYESMEHLYSLQPQLAQDIYITKHDAEFIEAYKEFMEQVVSLLPGLSNPPPIISVCGGSGNGLDPCPFIQKAAIPQFNSNRIDKWKAMYTTIKENTWNLINGKTGDGSYQGCDAHYNERGHKVVASEIGPQIAEILGWQELVV